MAYKILNKIIESNFFREKTYPERYIDCSGQGILQVRYILEDLDKAGLWAELVVEIVDTTRKFSDGTFDTYCNASYFTLKQWDEYKDYLNSTGRSIKSVLIVDLYIKKELLKDEYASLPDLEYWRERILG